HAGHGGQGLLDPGDAGGAGEVRATRLRGAAPELDGQVDAVWATATPVTWDTDWSGRATGVRTTARFLWSERALYALWELEGAGLHTDTSRPVDRERERLYQEDCVELFLTPDPARPRRYFEIEVGPFGHVFDIDVDRDAKREDVAWSSGAKVGTRRDAAGRKATIEVALTAGELVAALGPGKRLPLGLFRMEGKREAGRDRLYLAFRPTRTPKPNFHVPEAFGRLVLAP
ncbi:MAG TPA: carbohydrate-binding family 9-like protein, partial [Polyangiaceae bacterium]|nr:carbohydrate-binding family 9-like protein [Polyangiaceae bacterium]